MSQLQLHPDMQLQSPSLFCRLSCKHTLDTQHLECGARGADWLPWSCGRRGGWGWSFHGSDTVDWRLDAPCSEGVCLQVGNPCLVLARPTTATSMGVVPFLKAPSRLLSVLCRGESLDPLIRRWRRFDVVPFLKASSWSSCHGGLRHRLFTVAHSRLMAPLTP